MIIITLDNHSQLHQITQHEQEGLVMYVCVCNGIREKQVRKAVNEGASTVGRVFKAHGCKADCAQCVNCMRDVIEKETQTDNTLLAAE